ncbi:hypothetical protein K488DRAFT_50365 [Vararia minispora EC-137]|uniref:Uncharacterized protein n=1 Tax=Vararia minispora EC-137 TaxID=1314806 RepID=A0ACB8QKI4_9AGAM|nr:hypothetical protein K488DRAFT_50365 [Vararia minispora EC-137]
MDKTKSRLAAFFNTDEEESSLPQKTLDSEKLSQFAHGTVRKSKREKEKEAAEAKRKEEEESAAKAYAEFLDAFEGEDQGRKNSSAFVRPVNEDGRVYAPSMSKPQATSRSMRAFERSPSPLGPPKPKGRRAMDAFLEEIKNRDQAEREARFSSRGVTECFCPRILAAYEGQSGSRDRGDPETSNVFVANLPPHVTEQSLGMFFARCGPVGSVKIMWPRSDASQGPGADMTSSRRSKSAGLSGFVSFMKRKDAEAALRELDGFDWGGSVLRVGWSKAVPIAARPKYGESYSSGFASLSRSPSRERHKSRSRSPLRRTVRNRSPSRSRSYSRSPSPRRRRRSYSRPRYNRHGSRSPRRRSPVSDDDDTTDGFIRTIATQVRDHGEKYEESLRERERSNSRYTFLTDPRHRKHRYYRSLVGKREGSLEPEFDDEGYNSVYSTDSAEESEREQIRKTRLGKLARRRFEAMLRALGGTREEIARCMAFSLEHAEAANEVSDVIIASLVVDGTPVPRKISRLYLICDILHNSAAPLPMAWKFRQEFQSRLGFVFDHLSTIYHSFPGRITADTFKKQVLTVVDIWDDWIVFPPDFTAELRQRLEGQDLVQVTLVQEEEHVEVQAEAPAVSRFKTSSFKPAQETTEPAAAGDDGEPMDEGSSVDGEPVDDVDGVPMDDVDGEPMGDDVDGEPMDGEHTDGVPIDGEPIDGTPLDGEPLDGEPIDDDVDGAPIDEDVDGEPVEDVDGEPMEDVDGEPVTV